MQGREVAVVGAGIGGLAAALCLARRGARVTVLERAPALREVGAGLQISPNGHRVLNALGLAPALAESSLWSRAVVLRSGVGGGRIARLRLPGEARAHWRLVHRADLVAILSWACREAGVAIRLGAPVAQVATTERRPVIALEDGERLAPALVVGADGIRSIARGALDAAQDAAQGGAPGADARARFSGQTAWRALVPAPESPEAASTVHLFPGRHVVSYPVRGGALVNVVAVAERQEWAEEGWDVRDDPARLRAAFADAHPALRRLLDAVDEVHLWGLVHRPVTARWGAQGIALVGDAAHPTLPFLAQGANLALEDAWALAAELDAPVSIDRALRGYEARRRPRAVRAIAAAQATAREFHLAGARRRAAHLALRLGATVAPWAISGRLRWLHGHDETRGERLAPAFRSGVEIDP